MQLIFAGHSQEIVDYSKSYVTAWQARVGAALREHVKRCTLMVPMEPNKLLVWTGLFKVACSGM